jgi:hypothetical protein
LAAVAAPAGNGSAAALIACVPDAAAIVTGRGVTALTSCALLSGLVKATAVAEVKYAGKVTCGLGMVLLHKAGIRWG